MKRKKLFTGLLNEIKSRDFPKLDQLLRFLKCTLRSFFPVFGFLKYGKKNTFELTKSNTIFCSAAQKNMFFQVQVLMNL